MKHTLLTLALAAITGGTCFAGTAMDDKKAVVPVEELFRAGETQFDVYGVYGTGNVDKSERQVNYTYKKTETETVTRRVFDPQSEREGRTVTETREKTVKKRGNYRVTDYQHNTFGGGIGLSHFFTRNLGVGLEGYWMTEDTVIHTVAANIIYRFPWENDAHTFGVAPYVFTGGGGQFDGINAAFWDIGGGIEARFCRRFGVFADGRYVLHDSSIQYGLFRLGARLVF
jgi:hypothetical protein